MNRRYIQLFVVLLNCFAVGVLNAAVLSQQGSTEREILATFEMQVVSPMSRASRGGRFYQPTKQYRQSIFDDQLAIKFAKRHKLRKVAEWPIKVLNVHCVVYRILSDEPIQDVVDRLSKDEAVESIQTMTVFNVKSSPYNDPYLKLQHNVQSLDVTSAHQVSTGRGVSLAVIDSGVDIDHPELVGKVSVRKNFVSARQGGAEDKDDIHGTAVAGVIASAVNNGVGIVGIAPEVQVWALKACWQLKKSSSEALCNTFTLAQALSYAIEQKVDILNMSLSGPEDALVRRLVDAALQAGIIVVSAYDQYSFFPASVDRVIAVSENKHAGDNEQMGFRYNLQAPGRDILTTLPNGHYDYISGSSFAAAHISAITALLLQHQSSLTVEQVYQLLSDANNKPLNACHALQRLLKSNVCQRANL